MTGGQVIELRARFTAIIERAIAAVARLAVWSEETEFLAEVAAWDAAQEALERIAFRDDDELARCDLRLALTNAYLMRNTDRVHDVIDAVLERRHDRSRRRTRSWLFLNEDPMTRDKLYSVPDLKDRGWTATAIKQFLPAEPDDTRDNPRYAHVESDHNDGAETLPSAGCNYTADQLRNWLRVTESSIEVIEAAIAATPQSLSAALREHVVELYSTRDLTRSAIEQAEEEPARSVTLTEQLLALRNDEATIDVRITQLTAMIPTALSPHRGALQDELLKYVPARNRTRSAIHRTIEMQHAGRRWVTATQHARPRLCTAQSGRHSRSSRRSARIARAAKKATADPDGPWSARSTFGSPPEVSS